MTSKQKIDRREFLTLVGAASGSVALAACAPGATTAPAPVEAPAVQALKTVHYAMAQAVTSADTLDPAFRTSGTDAQFQSALYEQLVVQDKSLKPTPLLAESWESNETGSEWTFKLREGVTFHDGKPFVAADVVYTYQRLIDPDVGSPGGSNLTGLDPDGIVAVDDHTVRFKLSQANVDFPGVTIFSQSMIVPEGATNDDLAVQSNGTGSFKAEAFTPGDLTTVFVKNENYWQAGLPKIDVLELHSISEPESRLAALKGGQVDIIQNAPSTALDDLESDPAFNLAENLIGTSTVAVCQIDVPPFDDNNVRLAIKYATDRQGMLDLVRQGRGTLMNDTPIPSLIEYGLPGPPREYNVEKAKELLSMAGYPNGIDLTFKTSTIDDTFVAWATVWQQQLAEANINMEIDIQPADTYWDVVWLQEPFYHTGWNVRTTDAAMGLWYRSEADWNETHWLREDWDALLVKARATLDVNERTNLYHQMQQQIVDEGGHFVPYMASFIDATRSNISGWAPAIGANVYRDLDIG